MELNLFNQPELEKDIFKDARFNGSDYVKEFDQSRLTGQLKRVYELMIDGMWRTLSEIAITTNDPEASISAQLRFLRRERFGSHLVEKRSRGERENGLWEYRVLKQKSL